MRNEQRRCIALLRLITFWTPSVAVATPGILWTLSELRRSMSHRKATSDSHETQSFHHARSNFYRSREKICENLDRDFLTELKFPRSTIRKFNSHSVRSFHIYAESIESMLVLTESGVRRNCRALSGRCCCNASTTECSWT